MLMVKVRLVFMLGLVETVPATLNAKLIPLQQGGRGVSAGVPEKYHRIPRGETSTMVWSCSVMIDLNLLVDEATA